MPLTKLVTAHRAAVRAFLDDQRSNLLLVSSPPDTEFLAAKLIASLDEDPASDEIFFAHAGPFVDGRQFYAAAAASVVASFDQHREALKSNEVMVGSPSQLDPELASSAPEIAFAELMESARCAMAEVCGRVVLALRPDEGADQAEVLRSLRALAALSPPNLVKYILFAPSWPPDAFADLPPARRLAVVDLELSMPQSRHVLRDFLVDPRRRVLVGEVPGQSEAMVEDALRQAGRELTGAHTVGLSLGTRGISTWFTKMADGFIRHVSSRSFDLGPSIGEDIDESVRASLLAGRLGRSVNGGRGQLLVTVDVSAAAQDGHAPDVVAFILRLADLATSPRVRFIVLNRSASSVLPALEEAPRPVSKRHISLDGNAIEEGIEERLKDPALPRVERIRYLGATASLAAVRKDHEGALVRHEEALQLAGQTGDPRELAMAYLALGNTLYGMERWDLAEQAYSACVARSLDADYGAGVSHGFLNLGHTFLRAARYEDAGPCYRSAVEWFDRGNDPVTGAHALVWLGETHRRTGDLAGAETAWVEARGRYESLDPNLKDGATAGRAEVLERLARLREQMKDQAGADASRRQLRELGETEAFVPERP
jgi:tetratricopeptide (TPR) repeat protein